VITYESTVALLRLPCAIDTGTNRLELERVSNGLLKGPQLRQAFGETKYGM